MGELSKYWINKKIIIFLHKFYFMKYPIFPIFLLLSLISCRKFNQDNLINEKKITVDYLNKKGYFFYPSSYLPNIPKNSIKKYNKNNGFYSNVKPYSLDTKRPTPIFTKDFKYFVETLNSKYEIYNVVEGKVKLGIVYVINENSKADKIKSLNDMYNYLNKKGISFKVLKERKDSNNIPYSDILLTKDSLFCRVRATNKEILYNIYNDSKDTLTSLTYGDTFPFFRGK